MTRLFGKFGFIHRRLWDRDVLYRVALLFGPAPLLGGMLAAAIWAGFHSSGPSAEPPPPWAVVQRPAPPSSADAAPRVVQPNIKLPQINPDGSVAGYQMGWTVLAHPITVSATLNVEVEQPSLSNFNTFFLDGPSVDMARILAAGPKDQLYVGTGSGFLVVRAAGIHALTARFERPAGSPASCLVRLAFGPARVISNLELELVNSVTRTFTGGRFDLQPGLYPISWAFGCWRDQQMMAPARMTLLVGHPGEETQQPARPWDIVR